MVRADWLLTQPVGSLAFQRNALHSRAVPIVAESEESSAGLRFALCAVFPTSFSGRPKIP